MFTLVSESKTVRYRERNGQLGRQNASFRGFKTEKEKLEMKRVLKVLGLIAVVTVMGFSMMSCGGGCPGSIPHVASGDCVRGRACTNDSCAVRAETATTDTACDC